MLYTYHGLGINFDSYDACFDESADTDVIVYLALAIKLIHTIRSNAITIAQDMSGMTGLSAAQPEGGCGFDYRLAMGIFELLV